MNLDHIDLIDRYCRGSLSEAEKRDFEQKMNQNPGLKEEVEQHADLIKGMQHHFSSELKSRLKESDQASKGSKGSKSYRRIFLNSLAVAATISLFFVLGYVLMDNASPEALYQTHYQAYPNIVNPVERSASAESSELNNAMRAYEQGDYQEAVTLFEQAEEPLSTSYEFYLAISYLELANYQNAVELLKKVEQSEVEAYHYPALWYQGMAYLVQKDTENAKQILKQLSESGDNYYSTKASELLQEL
ncbi:tetratricopeptide repeat protein [Catalinimonas sp. 4WD22]|uniref:tetratricopeptide repeat protein n=1 Tax=Catalinimonas locisalis TaxID=3133978 RepID=UPI0031011B75